MNKEPVLLALDLGSSSVKAWALGLDGQVVARAACRLEARRLRPGWAEQDATEWREGAVHALAAVVERCGGRRFVALGLTGQSPSLVGVDADLHPVTPALPYWDNRATAEATRLLEVADAPAWHRRTGHTPSAFVLASKAAWLQAHCDTRPRWWLQARDFVAAWLTGRVATDPTHAAATMLFDLDAHAFAADLTQVAGLDVAAWPPVLEPHAVTGGLDPAAALRVGLPAGLPVVIGAADSQSCLLGVGAAARGQVSEMAGSSTCLNMVLASRLALPTVDMYPAAGLAGWVSEVGLNATGSSLAWAVRALGVEGGYDGVDVLVAKSEPGADGLLFLPFLADGDRDDANRVGGFLGLSLGHGPEHLVRSVLEGVALAIRWRLEQTTAAGASCTRLVVSGGGGRLGSWNQIKADVLGVSVTATDQADGAAVGAAVLAAMGVGVLEWGRFDHPLRPPVTRYEPNARYRGGYDDLYARFLAAIA